MNDIILTERSNLIAIADATRNKTGLTNDMNLGDIVEAINSIPEASSGGTNTSDATVTASDILNGKIAYGANGKVTGTIPSQEGSVITPNNQTQTAITGGTYATGDITVSAVPTETKNITSNGAYTPTDGKYFSSVNVDIPSEEFHTQSKTVSPTEQQQIVTPDSGYNGLSKVTVNAIESDYVGSNVPRENAKTIIPTKSSQVAVSGGTYINGDVSVGAIPDEYITTTDANATASDLAKDKTAYVNGVKITGTHTCSTGGGSDTSDATATAEDILLGETAYINGGKVTGSMVVQSYYVSNVAPSSTLGNDGDLCLVRAGE